MPWTPSHKPAAEAFATALTAFGQGLAFHEADVLADLIALESAFPDASAYGRALSEILHQLRVAVEQMPGREMVGRVTGWRRYAFRSDRQTAGVRADLRIVYRVQGGRLVLFGFGHRSIPEDVYLRLRNRPLPE